MSLGSWWMRCASSARDGRRRSMKKLANDSSVSAIPLDDIEEGLRRHEELLKRLPDHGLSI